MRFTEVSIVASQREPDPDFPTVPFPNPEEPGVMTALFALAEQCGAQVALANDPDVDRLAVGVPSPSGKFTQLTGNQVGVLLADFLLEQGVKRVGLPPPLVVQSVVSTPMLANIAQAYGATCERTLTGFKWISRPAITLGDTVTFVLGFEEAIGYAVLPDVRDKDGISAALVMAQLVNARELDGSTLLRQLFELYQRHGLWVSAQHNVTLPGAAGIVRIQSAMEALRTGGWTHLADEAVTRTTDYSKDAELRPVWLGKSNLVELELGELGRVLVRPSGTEPKLKIYVDIRGPAPSEWHHVEAAEGKLQTRARELALALATRLGLG
jgi:phosphomannomutase